ncbi:helix-turn-helix domain-containing protein [Streptomyces sp. NPDC056121]|uniref:helix-turn-helix domain-containing protein n=1 Tax=unclassified Streptomyces TaxID=2593676 RepID=UPI0035DFDA97
MPQRGRRRPGAAHPSCAGAGRSGGGADEHSGPGEPAQAGLRETPRTFLTHHRSYAATAQALNLHRDSVQYRVQQATALLPRGDRSLGDDFDGHAALPAAQGLGSTVPTCRIPRARRLLAGADGVHRDGGAGAVGDR